MVDKEAEARDRYSLVARATLDGVWDWNARTGDVFYSPRWQYILGLNEESYHATTSHWFNRIHPEDLATVREEIKKHLAGETPRFRSEHRMRHQDGSWRWVIVRGLAQYSSTGSATRMAGSLMDITEDKTSDPLTGLPNRTLLQERLAQLIQRSEATKSWQFAVLFMDVDRFKSINDRFGHLAGDTVLKVIGKRLESEVLKARLSMESVVSRFAGDEFVVVLDGIENEEQALAVAERFQHALGVPMIWQNEQLFAGASIGVAMATPAFRTPESFLYSADLAMYQAKSVGRGSSILFKPAMHEQTKERLELEAELRQAVELGQMRVLYQPQINLQTGRLVGCEALVRWQHPRRGLLAPAHFIQLAEEIGAISKIDLWVMQTACHQLSEWRKLPQCAELTMSVNISAQHFLEQGLNQIVEQTIARFKLPSAALCLELTESILIKDFTSGNRLMQQLRAIGVGLHMDDFGSGYSSFKQLYELPFDTLKIDRSLLAKIESDHQSANIVQGILRLAQSMRLKVVAEGIENPRQANILEEMGCDQGQGYHFDRPVAPEVFLRRHIHQASLDELSNSVILPLSPTHKTQNLSPYALQSLPALRSHAALSRLPASHTPTVLGQRTPGSATTHATG